MRCAVSTTIVIFLASACSSPSPIAAHPPTAVDEAAQPQVDATTFLLGEVPSVTITARCVFEGDVLVSTGAQYNARDCREDFGATPTVQIVIHGPETSSRQVLLSVSEGNSVWTLEAGRWVSNAVENKAIEVKRFLTPGRYHVSIGATASIPGAPSVELLVEPSVFYIVAPPATPVVDLSRRRIDPPQGIFASVVTQPTLGWVFAETFAQGFGLYTNGRERQARIPDGTFGAVATSPDAVAVFHTAPDGAPTVSVYSSALELDMTVALLPGSSLRGEQYMRIVWNEEATEWAVAWTAYEKLTDAEQVRKSRNGCQIEWGAGISRTYLARISTSGTAKKTLIGEVNLVDLAANGREYGVLTTMADCEWISDDLLDRRLRLSVVSRGSVARRQTFQRPQCLSSAAPPVVLSHVDGRYVAVVQWHGWRALHRLEVVGLAADGASDAGEVIVVDPDKEINHASSRSLDGVVWLAYASVEKRTGREQVVVLRLGPDLSPDAAFVVDDGYDRVEALELFDDGPALSLAVFRGSSDPFVLDLAPLLAGAELAELPLTDLVKPSECDDGSNGVDFGPGLEPGDEITGAFGRGRSAVDP